MSIDRGATIIDQLIFDRYNVHVRSNEGAEKALARVEDRIRNGRVELMSDRDRERYPSANRKWSSGSADVLALLDDEMGRAGFRVVRDPLVPVLRTQGPEVDRWWEAIQEPEERAVVAEGAGER